MMGAMMFGARRERVEKRGWRLGTVEGFLGLSSAEAAYVELRLRLSETLRDKRKSRRLTQTQVARLLDSSQSRVAKMEGGDPSVSLDLLIRSLLTLGASRRDLGRAIGPSELRKASGHPSDPRVLPDGWESLAVATSPKFQAIIERSRKSRKPGLSTEEMRRRLGLERGATPDDIMGRLAGHRLVAAQERDRRRERRR
jgi:transcriptional regulator with XRE-family HTH domain